MIKTQDVCGLSVTEDKKQFLVSEYFDTSIVGFMCVNLCGLIHTTKPYDSTSRKQILNYYN